ncbi:hypothetical protein EAI_01423 [Harpegnathos saltator]|uniref:Uncharacterized protein n=1 Tax=Harpegnathos saltator TaxID=610380 RepID=E2B9K0_HARSA|nr:hypothetical protein EAI_01423 [Harpegnathos saltator]
MVSGKSKDIEEQDDKSSPPSALLTVGKLNYSYAKNRQHKRQHPAHPYGMPLKAGKSGDIPRDNSGQLAILVTFLSSSRLDRAIVNGIIGSQHIGPIVARVGGEREGEHETLEESALSSLGSGGAPSGNSRGILDGSAFSSVTRESDGPPEAAVCGIAI